MNNKKREKRKLRKLHEFLIQHDIRYLGPISYQGFQILGWICIVLSVVLTFLSIAGRFIPSLNAQTESFWVELNALAGLALPFLLISNFSRILSNNEGYKTLLLRNGGIALGIILFSCFSFMHHVVGTLEFVMTDKSKILSVLTNAVAERSRTGYIAFNLFIDLFIYSDNVLFERPSEKILYRKKGTDTEILRSAACNL